MYIDARFWSADYSREALHDDDLAQEPQEVARNTSYVELNIFICIYVFLQAKKKDPKYVRYVNEC